MASISIISNKTPKFSTSEVSSSSSSSSSASIDRLTSLPDSLRLHILSLLPFRSAIQTSALSSQWRHLYKHRAQNLLLSLSPTFSPSDIHRALAAGPPPLLDSLHLASYYHADLLHHLPYWLALASCRRVQDITIELNQADDITIPIPFSFPGSLVRLTLICLRVARPPDLLINLSSLEILNLYHVQITDADLQAVVRGCYVLKTLDIRRCSGLRQVVVPGSGLWLRNVTVVECPKVSEIWIRGRARRFHFCGRFLSSYRLDSVLTLELEDVYMSCGGRGVPLGTNWWLAFGRLSHVKVLTLCNMSLRYVAASGDFRNFPCLRELQLLMMTMNKFIFMDIWNFFRLCFCPGLEKLFIEFSTHMSHLNMEELLNVVEEQPAAGLFTNLKIIKINRFEGHLYQMLLVKILLWKATCLEYLLIVTPQVHSHTLHFLRMELDLMVKSSKNAKIIVREEDDHRVRPTHDEAYC